MCIRTSSRPATARADHQHLRCRPTPSPRADPRRRCGSPSGTTWLPPTSTCGRVAGTSPALKDARWEFTGEVNNTVHRSVRRRPVEALAEAAQRLHWLPEKPFTEALGTTRKVGGATTAVGSVCYAVRTSQHVVRRGQVRIRPGPLRVRQIAAAPHETKMKAIRQLHDPSGVISPVGLNGPSSADGSLRLRVRRVRSYPAS